jgi:hypothetical protein
MAGKRGFRSYPRHLGQPKGKGIKECEATGFLRPIGQQVSDVRQGLVAKEFADITRGFGTRHPQDVVKLGVLDDPSPIDNARPKNDQNLSKQDLAMSDQEIEASIREGRPPRIGF